MKRLIQLIIIGLVIMAFSACSSKLSTGYHNYNQVRKAGYDCKPFKGSKYFRFTPDSTKANVVKL